MGPPLTDRRAFLRALALIFPSLPHLANAQGSANGVRVGYLTANPGMAADLIRSFLQGLREVGYDEGRNLTFERRYDELKTETLSAMAADLVRQNSDVIVVVGPEARLRAVRQATTTIPIVIIAIDYGPVARGYMASLARPGGNITGLFVRQPELAGKRVDLLKAALPAVRRVAVLWDNFSADQLEETERVSRSLGLEFVPVELRNAPYDFASALRTVERARSQALLSSASPLFYAERVRIAELAARSRLPLVAPFRQFADVGALVGARQ